MDEDVPPYNEADEEEDSGPKLEPIDPIFHSFLHDGPFEECLVCSCDLRQTHYLVHKTWVGEEVIFEYAMCHSCAEDLQSEMSEESVARLSEFLETQRRREGTYEVCNYCEKPIGECKERSLNAACFGMEMDTRHYPLMICGECSLQVQEMLSQQTRDRRDRFIGEHFDCPPSMEIPLPTELAKS